MIIAYDDGEVRQEFAICLRGRLTEANRVPAWRTIGQNGPLLKSCTISTFMI